MKILKCQLLSSLAAFALCSGADAAEDCHTHSPHDGGGSSHLSYSQIDDWTDTAVYVDDTPSEEIVYSSSTDNCSCGSATWTHSDEATVTHTVSVSGSATGTIKTSMLTSLIARGSVEVTVGGGYSYENAKTITVTISKTMPQCTRHTYKKYFTKHHSTATQNYAVHKWNDHGYTEEWYFDDHAGSCCPEEISGDAVGWDGEHNEFTSPGSCSAAPCNPVTCP